jgi:hypothetical protein
MSEHRAFDPATMAALALWVVVGAGLFYGVWQTVGKVANLF